MYVEKDCPFVCATLDEVFRFRPVADTLPHATTADVMIDGHLIKKDTIVYGSLTAIMHDAKHFSQPQIFNPNRFINEGKFVKDPRVCVFSTGLRNCVGKKLAQIELFTFAANIIHRFKLIHQEGDLVPMKHNTLLKPNDFRVQFQAR